MFVRIRVWVKLFWIIGTACRQLNCIFLQPSMAVPAVQTLECRLNCSTWPCLNLESAYTLPCWLALVFLPQLGVKYALVPPPSEPNGTLSSLRSASWLFHHVTAGQPHKFWSHIWILIITLTLNEEVGESLYWELTMVEFFFFFGWGSISGEGPPGLNQHRMT